jgi:hypothetical protein
MISEKTGASNDNTGSTMVPTILEIVTLAFKAMPMPTGIPQRRLDVDCQLIVTPAVHPTRIDGV